MPRLGGPSEGSRRLLCATVESVVLYAASIWREATRREVHRKKLLSVQRKIAICIARAYRTVSTEALLVVARTPPIHLLVQRRAEVEVNGAACRTEATNKMMDEWQEEWSRTEATNKMMDEWQEEWSRDTGRAVWTNRPNG
ncbi:hypothetical protein QE152_g1723 [Popillia japonica]|uniref:Uncharacterized protein n=1 Tax=Popillia japonica TaxID=7064 RepID=A0AAW1N1E2_POPJA